jgi:hypothetical protein
MAIIVDAIIAMTMTVIVCDCAMDCDSVTECVTDYVIVRLCD